MIDTSVAHPARVYDYWLGGKDNFDADRRAAEAIIAVRPAIVRDIRANRGFMRRAVAYLAAEGVRQFLDIGSGIPTKPNLHEVVQSITPDARIVYADNDPVVLSHARALLASTPEGATAYIQADLRDPGAILQEAARTLDFAQPTAVVLASVLQLISDTEDPYAIVARFMGAVARGSYLVLTHPASDILGELVAESARRYNQSVATPVTLRSFGQVASFFDGLELVDPGIVQCHRWRPERGVSVDEYQVAGWGAVARKGRASDLQPATRPRRSQVPQPQWEPPKESEAVPASSALRVASSGTALNPFRATTSRSASRSSMVAGGEAWRRCLRYRAPRAVRMDDAFAMKTSMPMQTNTASVVRSSREPREPAERSLATFPVRANPVHSRATISPAVISRRAITRLVETINPCARRS